MQRTHMKNAEKWNTCTDGICSILACVFLSQIKIVWLLIWVLLLCITNPACVKYDRLETGLILPLCRTSRPTVGERGGVCRSVRHKLSVGRSARLLGIVTRPVLAVSCSNQCLIMWVSSETASHRLSVCRMCYQLSPFLVSWHEIWNRTQCIAVVVTSERLGQWIVT